MKSASKLKDEARKHEQHEEWDRAIQLYLQVLRGEEDAVGESELPLYNRIGDLYVRQGRPADAVKYYEQAADRYAQAGLFNNAIALCNKALRYQPARLSLFRKLGEFCAQQGFLTDARRWYIEFADRMFKQGERDQAFGALDDFANISDDPDARLLLGRRLQAYERSEEALEEFRRAYAWYVAAGQDQSAETVRAEVLELFGGSPDLAQDEHLLAGARAGGRYPELAPTELPTFGDVPDELPREEEPVAPTEDEKAIASAEAATLEGFEGTQLADTESLGSVDSGTLAGLDTGRDDTLERMRQEAEEPAAEGLPLLGDESESIETAPAPISGLPLLGEEPLPIAAPLEPLPDIRQEVEPEPPPPEIPPPQATPPPASTTEQYVDLYALLAPDEDRVETTRFFIQESEPTGDEDHDFAELLNEFRAKLAEHVPENDAGSHYDLGLAFKEMGLIDDAISEFQIALRAGQDRLKVFEELGQCFIQKAQYNIAVKVLNRALQFEHRDELELIGVYYFIGRAYEALGQTSEARDAYERVLGLDIRFQDVQQRVARL
jgi:tetratricopeptide (TPR) repeat protein